jgi:hypothetical protein
MFGLEWKLDWPSSSSLPVTGGGFRRLGGRGCQTGKESVIMSVCIMSNMRAHQGFHRRSLSDLPPLLLWTVLMGARNEHVRFQPSSELTLRSFSLLG